MSTKSSSSKTTASLFTVPTVAVASDHAGYELKEKLKRVITLPNHRVEDFGVHTSDPADYPDLAHSVARSIESKELLWAVLLCGSANGMSMTANKYLSVRAAVCWSVEIATLARQHNNANILCLPARFISFEEAKKIIQAFATTSFEHGRHERRVDKISCV